jgi:hypothetical protein
MNPDALLNELDREPFIPLRLHLADGRSFDIGNPALCFVAHLALYVFRVGQRRRRLAEDVEVYSLRHIVSIETVEQPRSA